MNHKSLRNADLQKEDLEGNATIPQTYFT